MPANAEPRVLLINPLAKARSTAAKLTQAVTALLSTCSGSAAIKADPACAASITKLVASNTTLGANVTLVDGLDTQRETALTAQSGMVSAVSADATSLLANLQNAAQANPALLQGTTLKRRSAAVRLAVGATLAIPDEPTVGVMKNGDFKFKWLSVPGASGYTAQRALAPVGAAAPAWELLEGGGLSRKMTDLVIAQQYMFRVCAVANDSRTSAFSATVTFTTPPPAPKKKT